MRFCLAGHNDRPDSGLGIRLYGVLHQAAWLLYGVKPVVVAVIIQLLWSLMRKAIKNLPLGLVGSAVLALYFLGINKIALLFGGGLVVMLAATFRRLRQAHVGALLLPLHTICRYLP